MAAVTKPKPPPDQLEDLLRWLLANMAAPVPVPAPVQEVPTVAKLRQHLVAEIQSRQPAAVTKPKPPLDQLEDQLRRLLSNKAAPVPVPAPVRLVPTVNKLLQRLVAETQSRQPVAGRSPEPVGFGSYLSGQQTSGPQIRRIPVRRTQSRQPAAVSSPEPVRFGSYLSGQQTSRPQIRRIPVRRDRDGVGCFSCRKSGHRFRLCYQDGEWNRRRVVLL